MRGAEALARVAVVILVQEDQVSPVRILLELAVVRVHGATSRVIAGEDADHRIGEPSRHLLETDGCLAAPPVDLERVAISLLQLPQRFDQQEAAEGLSR